MNVVISLNIFSVASTRFSNCFSNPSSLSEVSVKYFDNSLSTLGHFLSNLNFCCSKRDLLESTKLLISGSVFFNEARCKSSLHATVN